MIELGPDSVIWLVEVAPRHPDTLTPTWFRWSDVDYMTRPTDSPANAGYDAILANPLNYAVDTVREVEGVPVYGGVAAVSVEPIEIHNADPEGGEVRELTALVNWGWDDAEVIVRRGVTEWDAVTGSWIPVALASFEVLVHGVAVDFDPGSSGIAKLSIADPAQRIRVPAQSRTFAGFPAAVRLDGASGSGLVVTHATAMNAVTSAVTVAVLVRPTAAAIASGAFLLDKFTAGQTPFRLRISGGGLWRARITTSAGALEQDLVAAVADRWVWVGLTWDGTTASKFVRYLDEAAFASWLPTLHGGVLHTNTTDLLVGRAAGSNYMQGDVASVRWYGRAFTQEELADRLARPIDLESGELGTDSTVVYLPFADRFGSVVGEMVGEYDAAITGGEWISTGEGGAELAGRRKPKVLGSVYQVPAVPVDKQLQAFAVSDQAVELVRYVYAGLVGLAPTRSVTSAQVNFNSARKRIRCLNEDLLFVPDQLITVSGSASNNGDRTIDRAEQNRRVLAIADAVVAEGPGPSVTLTTKAGTEEWAEDGGLVTIDGNFGGEVTADVLGENAGGKFFEAAAEVVAYLLTEMGSALDPADLDNVEALGEAPVGLWIADDITAADLVDSVAQAVGVAVIPGLDGRIRFRTLAVGAPVEEFEKEDVISLELIKRSKPRPSQVQVGYRRAHRVTADPPDVVTGWVKDFAAKEHRVARYPADPSATVLGLHPAAKVFGPLGTPLDREADARATAEMVYERAGWDRYRARVLSRSWAREIGDTVRIYHPDYSMSEGADLVVVGFDFVSSLRSLGLILARPPA